MDNQNIGFILCESSFADTEFNIVSEEAGRVLATGTLQEADAINRNRRYYATKDLANELCAPRQRELLSKGNMYGEAGHPMSTDLRRQSTIEPKNIQVMYTKFWMEGPLVKGNFMGTFNQYGDEFDRSLRFGCKPSFSLRALGSIRNENGKAYVRNLKFITYDRVIFPSHTKAYTDKIISESVEFGENGIIAPEGNQIYVQEGYQVVAPITNRSVADYVMQESANLKTIIQNFDTFYESITVSEDCRTVNMIDKNYNQIIVPVEQYVRRSIMDCCDRM